MLPRLGFSEREAELACVAGYLHDVGNALARDAHGQTGAILAYQALRDTAAGADLMPIMAAIANHEEDRGDRRLAGLRRGDPGGQVRRAPQPGAQPAEVRSASTSTTA